jgi:nucleotide-binding universal stress UspA family protein
MVLACVDGSSYSPAVCDAAVWAAQRLDAPLHFLHALKRKQGIPATDLSGSIGFGAREALLNDLAALDEARGKLAQERGRQLLATAQERARTAGIAEPGAIQRHGGLVEALTELEEGIRLLVLGQRGVGATVASEHLGSKLERVVRTMRRPILISNMEFRAPQRVMLAFDGSATTRKGIEMVAASPLFRGLPCHLVMAGADTADNRAKLDWARQSLEAVGFEAPSAILPGEAESVLAQYQRENGVDLMIMGAYGHSRIRQLLIGSTTTAMLRQSPIPVLLLR